MIQTILNNQTLAVDENLFSLAMHGYGCFTSFLVWDGKVKGLKLHIERLQKDAMALFGVELHENTILSNVAAFLSEIPQSRVGVRVTVFPKDFSLASPGSSEQLNVLVSGRAASPQSFSPLKVASVDIDRSYPLQKSVNMMANLKARSLAQLQGFDDALLLSGERIKEGSTWNLFLLQDNVLVTPPLQDQLLPGVTRQLILQLAEQAGISIQQRSIYLNELPEFDAAFATNAMIAIKPIDKIDKHHFASQNPRMQELLTAYEGLPDEPVDKLV